MNIDEKRALENEYEIWIDEHTELKDCSFNMITFLEEKGLLNNKENINVCINDLELFLTQLESAKVFLDVFTSLIYINEKSLYNILDMKDGYLIKDK